MSKNLLKEGMLAYHITAAITACIIMAIPLTRANRLAAMRESDERITSIFPPAFYVCPSRVIVALFLPAVLTMCSEALMNLTWMKLVIFWDASFPPGAR